jgi:hypothetical protein
MALNFPQPRTRESDDKGGQRMIWSAVRNAQQGQVVAEIYAAAAEVPCGRQAIMAGGLPGAGTLEAVAESGADLTQYLTISVDTVLVRMAAHGLIPTVAGLSPLEASDLAHAEAQFIAKRVGMLALAEGRNLLLDVSMAARISVDSWIAALGSAGYSVSGVFADISSEESVRRLDAAHRRGEERLRAGHGYGGRYIPPEAIRALADSGPAALELDADGGPEAWYPGGGRAAALIAAYRSGHLSLPELARAFESQRWTSVPRTWVRGMEDARAAIDDLEPVFPDTFDDVVLAYDLGQLTVRSMRSLPAQRQVAQARTAPKKPW